MGKQRWRWLARHGPPAAATEDPRCSAPRIACCPLYIGGHTWARAEVYPKSQSQFAADPQVNSKFLHSWSAVPLLDGAEPYANCNPKSDLGEFQLKWWNADSPESPEEELTFPFVCLFISPGIEEQDLYYDMANDKQLKENLQKGNVACNAAAVMSGTCQNLIWTSNFGKTYGSPSCHKTDFRARNTSCSLKMLSLCLVKSVKVPIQFWMHINCFTEISAQTLLSYVPYNVVLIC